MARGKQRTAYIMNMSEWLAKQGFGEVAKKLFRSTKDRDIIANVLEGHGT